MVQVICPVRLLRMLVLISVLSVAFQSESPRAALLAQEPSAGFSSSFASRGGGAGNMTSVQKHAIERIGRNGLPDILFTYPSIGHDVIDRDISLWATHIVSSFERDFSNASMAAAENDDDLGGYSLTGSYRVLRPSKAAVSITFELWMHTGSPVPGQDIITLNYSLLTGQRLELVDIFEDVEKVLEIMAEQSRKELARGVGGGRIDQTIRSGTEPVSENFSSLSLTPTGIQVHFQPYQVSTWAAGRQDVDIALEKLMPARPLLSLWGR